jgi:RNA polymerase sigma-70 factor (sigma-E family)
MDDSFDGFVAQRGQALLRFAHLLCGDAYLAEDLVQEVLARVHRRWNRIGRMRAPEAYLRTAIVREYLSLRRRKASTERVMAQVPETLASGDTEREVVLREHLWDLLSGLPRKQRAVLVLRFYCDLSDEEIARVLGRTRSTVRSQASRALARLRTELSDQKAVVPTRGPVEDRPWATECDGEAP